MQLTASVVISEQTYPDLAKMEPMNNSSTAETMSAGTDEQGAESDTAGVVVTSPLSDSNSPRPVHESDGIMTNPVVDTEEGAPTNNNDNDDNDIIKKETAAETLTDISGDDEPPESDGGDAGAESPNSPIAVVSSSKKSRPPYKYDPDKITLRFLFANRDGLAVTVECKPSDTVGEVKCALLSVWPEGEYSDVTRQIFRLGFRYGAENGCTPIKLFLTYTLLCCSAHI